MGAISLTDPQKRFIVIRLARRMIKTEIAAEFQEVFGFEVSRYTVSSYDPTIGYGSRLSERWRQLYEETRAAVVARMEREFDEGEALEAAAEPVPPPVVGKLTHEDRRFIVARLAAGATPTQIVDQFQREYGKTITRQAVQHYDPTTAQGRDLDPYYRNLYHSIRARRADGGASVAAPMAEGRRRRGSPSLRREPSPRRP